MTRPALFLVLLTVLAACGADGPPEPYERDRGGVTISGTASIGVVGN